MANIIQRVFQKKALRRLAPVRTRKYTSLDAATRIGFVFNENEPGVDNLITYIKETLGKKKKRYSCIGINLDEEITGNPVFISNPFILNIYTQDMNWYELPKPDLIKDFMSTKFDILINLTFLDSARIFPVEYLTKGSRASFKIGITDDYLSVYDMIITDKTSSSLQLLQGVFQYLTDLKSL